MKTYSREKMISLSGDNLNQHSIHLKLINLIKQIYGGNGRLIIQNENSSSDIEFRLELEKLGFSKYDCDYAMQTCGDPEKAANLLFMEYNLRHVMQTSFHFESFFVWENVERTHEDIIESQKPLCLVSSYEEFKELSRNVKDALAKNIPIVSQYFLWDSEYLKVKVFPEDYPIKEVKFLYDTYNDRNFLCKWSLEEFMMSDSLKHLLTNYDNSSPPSRAATATNTLPTSSSLSIVPHHFPLMTLPSRTPSFHEDTNKTSTISHPTLHGNANKMLQILANKEAPQEFNKLCNVVEMESQLAMFVHFLGQVLSDEKIKLSEKYKVARVIPQLLEFGNHSHNAFSKKVDELLIENKIMDKIIFYYIEYPYNNVVHSFVTNLLITIFQYYHFDLQIHLIKHLGRTNLQEFIIDNVNNNSLSPFLTMVAKTINHMCTYRKSFENFIFAFEPWRKFSETLKSEDSSDKQTEINKLKSQLKYKVEQNGANLLLQDKMIESKEWKALPCTLIESRKTTKYRCLSTECTNEVSQLNDYCSNACKIKDFKKKKSQKIEHSQQG